MPEIVLSKLEQVDIEECHKVVQEWLKSFDFFATQYVKTKTRGRIGVVVGFLQNGHMWIGWSQCRKGDKFDGTRALYMATRRAVAVSEVLKYLESGEALSLKDVKIKNGRTLRIVKNMIATLAGKWSGRRRRNYDDQKYAVVPARFALVATGN